MKLFAAGLALTAAQFALAHDEYETFIPYDCYRETPNALGKQSGRKITDYTTMLGLDAYAHKLSAVTACYDVETRLITGMTTSWSRWSNGVASDVKRLNIHGNISNLYHFDDNGALSAAGLSGLQAGQDLLWQQYWFQEASEDDECWHMTRKQLGTMNTSEWQDSRRDMYNKADINGDGSLDKWEAYEFFRRARPHDYNQQEIDVRYEHIDRAFLAAASLSSPPDRMSLNDYFTMEKIMEAWYSAGKYPATYKLGAGQTMRDQCKTQEFHEEDRIIYMRVRSTPDGIEQLDFQTIDIPIASMGNPVSDRHSWTDDDWIRFDNGVDLAGFWSMVDETTGNLNALGFVERDSICTQDFLDTLGPSGYTWISPKVPLTKPEVPEKYRDEVEQLQRQREEIQAGNLPQHEHDEKVETGLIVVTVIVWVAVAILLAVMVFQMCKQKGGN